MLSGPTSGFRFELYCWSKQDHQQPLKTLLVYLRATEQQRWVQRASILSATHSFLWVLVTRDLWVLGNSRLK